MQVCFNENYIFNEISFEEGNVKIKEYAFGQFTGVMLKILIKIGNIISFGFFCNSSLREINLADKKIYMFQHNIENVMNKLNKNVDEINTFINSLSQFRENSDSNHFQPNSSSKIQTKQNSESPEINFQKPWLNNQEMSNYLETLKKQDIYIKISGKADLLFQNGLFDCLNPGGYFVYFCSGSRIGEAVDKTEFNDFIEEINNINNNKNYDLKIKIIVMRYQNTLQSNYLSKIKIDKKEYPFEEFVYYQGKLNEELMNSNIEHLHNLNHANI